MARKAPESRAEAGRDPPCCLEKKPALPTPSPWASGLQTLGIDVCCLKPPLRFVVFVTASTGNSHNKHPLAKASISDVFLGTPDKGSPFPTNKRDMTRGNKTLG